MAADQRSRGPTGEWIMSPLRDLLRHLSPRRLLARRHERPPSSRTTSGSRSTDVDQAQVTADGSGSSASTPMPTAAGLDADPLDNVAWLKLASECVDLYDELDGHMDALEPPTQEIAEHVCLRLQEILQRCGVEAIAQNRRFDRTLHQPPPGGLPSGAGPGPEVNIISPGFRVGRRVLRRARVESVRASIVDATGEPT